MCRDEGNLNEIFTTIKKCHINLDQGSAAQDPIFEGYPDFDCPEPDCENCQAGNWGKPICTTPGEGGNYFILLFYIEKQRVNYFISSGNSFILIFLSKLKFFFLNFFLRNFFLFILFYVTSK